MVATIPRTYRLSVHNDIGEIGNYFMPHILVSPVGPLAKHLSTCRAALSILAFACCWRFESLPHLGPGLSICARSTDPSWTLRGEMLWTLQIVGGRPQEG